MRVGAIIHPTLIGIVEIPARYHACAPIFQGGGRDVRALAVSAYARQEDRQRALQAGFDDSVAKPAQIDDLFSAIERSQTSKIG